MKIIEKKIGDFSTITAGLVVKRKQAEVGDQIGERYKMLTLKSFNQDGCLNDEELDTFYSKEILDEKYLTQPGDVIVRLSKPYTSLTIDNEHKGLVIPSLFVSVRIKGNEIIPDFLSIYLNSEEISKYYAKRSIGSVIQIIKAIFIKEVVVNLPNVDEQKKIIKVNKLMVKEKKLLEKLLEEKTKYNKKIIIKMLNGELKNKD